MIFPKIGNRFHKLRVTSRSSGYLASVMGHFIKISNLENRWPTEELAGLRECPLPAHPPPPPPTSHRTKFYRFHVFLEFWTKLYAGTSPIKGRQIGNSTVLDNLRDFLFLADPLLLDDEWGPPLPSLALSVRLEGDFGSGIAVSHTLNRLPSVVLLLSWDDLDFGCGVCKKLNNENCEHNE